MTTFTFLADREPRLTALARLVTIAAENIRPDDRNWCAAAFWASTVKPLLLPLVGWERGKAPENAADPPELHADPWTFLDVRGALGVLEGEHRWTRPVSTVAEETLRSSRAFEVAVAHLYGLLPACRECECLRTEDVAA